jgi:hypothetical protein
VYALALSNGVPDLHRLLWWIAILGYAVLLAKLWFAGLCSTYRFFTAYLVYRLVRSVVLINMRLDTSAYAEVWLYSAPLSLFLYVLVVLELYSLVLRHFKGIATLGRWTVMTSLLISVVFSMITLTPDLGKGISNNPIGYFAVIERGVISSLIVFLLLITAFLVWYPVPLARNIVVYTIGYAAYFLSSNLTLFFRNLNVVMNTDAGTQLMQGINLALMAITICCLVLWILALSREGEKRTVALRARWRMEDEDHLIQQLATINATLLRSGRK